MQSKYARFVQNYSIFVIFGLEKNYREVIHMKCFACISLLSLCESSHQAAQNGDCPISISASSPSSDIVQNCAGLHGVS